MLRTKLGLDIKNEVNVRLCSKNKLIKFCSKYIMLDVFVHCLQIWFFINDFDFG